MGYINYRLSRTSRSVAETDDVFLLVVATGCPQFRLTFSFVDDEITPTPCASISPPKQSVIEPPKVEPATIAQEQAQEEASKSEDHSSSKQSLLSVAKPFSDDEDSDSEDDEKTLKVEGTEEGQEGRQGGDLTFDLSGDEEGPVSPL